MSKGFNIMNKFAQSEKVFEKPAHIELAVHASEASILYVESSSFAQIVCSFIFCTSQTGSSCK